MIAGREGGGRLFNGATLNQVGVFPPIYGQHYVVPSEILIGMGERALCGLWLSIHVNIAPNSGSSNFK